MKTFSNVDKEHFENLKHRYPALETVFYDGEPIDCSVKGIEFVRNLTGERLQAFKAVPDVIFGEIPV